MNEANATVILKKGEGRLLKSGGLWIFDNEIDRIEGTFINGDVVKVADFDGWPLGKGYINMNSKIRVRVLTRSKEDVIDTAFLRRRLAAAWDYRKHTVDTSSCRVVFGEADFLPGITIDKYEDVLVVESLALGIDRMKGQIIDLLKGILAEDGITIRGVYERSDAKERLKEGMERISGFIGEPFDTQVPITENGVRYLVDVAEGQKTGFFLDQKYNRKAIWPMAKGARVLDCFTHTGSFALNAAAAGAADVTAVDASETALCQAERNAELNGYFFVSGKKAGEGFSGEDMVNETGNTLRFKAADLVELLPAMEAAGDGFDLVILDPPAFAKSRQNVKNAEKGYRKINRAGMKLVKDGGYFATCSCSHFMTRELFEKMLREAAREAHVRLRQIEARTQGPDHPILWTAAESSYLKFYIFQVIKN